MWGREAFRIWAPDESEWSLWAKPTLFAQPEVFGAAELPRENLPTGHTPDTPELQLQPQLPAFDPQTAIVVDLPGELGVSVGLQLAELGWRPVPLYNATTGVRPEVPLNGILSALQTSTGRLAKLSLAPDAPPAFLLDSRRKGTGNRPPPGAFDNRSLVFPQDFPSASRLMSRGISRVLLLQSGNAAPQDDLCHVLRRWQEAGLEMHSGDPAVDRPPEPLTVPRPTLFRRLFYVGLALFGLYRNSAGGFGSIVPHPGSG